MTAEEIEQKYAAKREEESKRWSTYTNYERDLLNRLTSISNHLFAIAIVLILIFLVHCLK